ncbi:MULTISPECIES: DUF2322 family protein [Methylobacillus]|uniref:RNA polymerase factor sigma-32 n=1 Tax=Methylobacillus flagellatus (strain ATCC 51484 / DSM 6875 / VKM B-1610 / KT) TaxID=265072 RepID=Q1H4D4_METFK|nr:MULTISPECIES: DUF2322 family protein [Methylobacillus]ABE48653.1 conserved hypothetical protein [Methylobacillus flagellatus KT]MPS49310.1 DUF2322 family protein [Methylobacillus sp.]
MTTFSEILAGLESSDHIQKIELFDAKGDPAGIIENKPGSQGSVKVYHHLYKKYGIISAAAAREGLEIYAEHAADAQANPGKHPNIDRLFRVIENAGPLSVRIT